MVRQLNGPPNYRFNPRTPRYGDKKIVLEKASAYKKVSQPLKEEEVISFFFKNFPEECSMEELKQKFDGIGEVRDIFCPNKRDKNGHIFGFVRFPRNSDVEEMLLKLNNIWFGSYKLRAFVPKFNRVPIDKEKKTTMHVFPAGSGLRSENKTEV